MRRVGGFLEGLGGLWLTGAVILFVGIAIDAVFMGAWPNELEWLRERFASNAETFGLLAIPLDLAMMFGPGLVLFWLGSRLRRRI